MAMLQQANALPNQVLERAQRLLDRAGREVLAVDADPVGVPPREIEVAVGVERGHGRSEQGVRPFQRGRGTQRPPEL